MRIALVYNQKKEDRSQQTISTDDASDPPSTGRTFGSASTHRLTPQPSSASISDIYAEWDTVETIDAVRNALAEFHDVSLIEADEHAFVKLSSRRPEIVFNIAEGLHGVSREAQIPAMLELLQIPYSGSDPLTLAICLDKSRAKEILSYYNCRTPAFHVIHHANEISQLPALSFPRIVKPLHEGSSKGIYNSSLVNTRQEMEMEIRKILGQYSEPALIEEYLPGREFTVAMLGNGEQLTVLPIVEIKFGSLPEGVVPIYSFEAKWIWDQSDAPLDIFQCPASLTPDLRQEIEQLCRRAYTVLRCRDWCRIDVRLDAHGAPHILELNPLPGILPKPEDNSCFPKAARAAGVSYNRLLQTVLSLAALRHGLVSKHDLFYPAQREDMA